MSQFPCSQAARLNRSIRILLRQCQLGVTRGWEVFDCGIGGVERRGSGGFCAALLTIFVFALASQKLLANAEPSQPARKVSLQEFLDLVVNESTQIRSLQMQLRQNLSEIKARELELAPVVSLEASTLFDERENFSQAVNSRSRVLDFTLTKPFSSGTQLKFNAGLENLEDLNSTTGPRSLVDWDLSVSQSLWRNFFGRATASRREADLQEQHQRIVGIAFDRQTKIMELETAYWDYLGSLKERSVREANLGRSLRIEQWLEERLKVSAAETTDYLQAQALVAKRQLDLETVEDRIVKTRARLAGVLNEGFDFEAVTVDERELERSRALEELMFSLELPGADLPSRPQRLDALAARFDALAKKSVAEKAQDEARPRLELVFTYGQTGADNLASTALEEASRPAHTFQKVGVLFTTDMDFSLKQERIRGFQSQAESLDLKATSLEREGQIQLQELYRSLERFKSRIFLARKVGRIQKEKSIEERRRFETGRSTPFQAITFEIDAADAELSVWKLETELRQLEAQARLFLRKGS